MASKRRIRKNACTGKRKFEDKVSALNTMHRVKRETKQTSHMSAYKCKFCGQYHYGHTPRRKNK